MNTQKTIKIYTISDSTGETVQGLARAVRVRFENVEQIDHTLVKTLSQIEKIGEGINCDTVVLYTIVDTEMIEKLESICKAKSAKAMSLLKPVCEIVESIGGVAQEIGAGAQHAMDAEYFSRVSAIDYAVSHDDGNNADNLKNAEVVLIGASRTSKSPTSFYLANKGIKTGNIPFINGIDLPNDLFNLPSHILVIGLTRDAESLVNIRRSRLQSLNVVETTDYMDIDKVNEEIIELKKICASNSWAVIDVSNKSIEETATQIIKYLNRYKEKIANEK